MVEILGIALCISSFSGIAYGPGGIQIAIPQSETNNFSGGGSGMSIPEPEILYEK